MGDIAGALSTLGQMLFIYQRSRTWINGSIRAGCLLPRTLKTSLEGKDSDLELASMYQPVVAIGVGVGVRVGAVVLVASAVFVAVGALVDVTVGDGVAVAGLEPVAVGVEVGKLVPVTVGV